MGAGIDGHRLPMDLRSRALAAVDEAVSCRAAVRSCGWDRVRWHDQRSSTGRAEAQGAKQDCADVLSARDAGFGSQPGLAPSS